MPITNNGVSMRKEKTRQITEWVEVASETSDDYSRLTPVALQLLKKAKKDVAVIGLGFGVLPRLLARHHRVTAYEIEPEVAEWFNATHPWAGVSVIVGDYQNTLNVPFDFIVYDLGGPAPDWLDQFGQVIVP